MAPTYSFVIPVHNEEDVLHHLYEELGNLFDQLDGPAEVVFVDDGSTDGSWAILGELTELDERLSAVRLSRNFGHQVAVSAGLDRAIGAAVVVMDADLQDPPEVVLAMAVQWREGFDVVYGQRVERQLDSRFKRATAAGFYRVLNGLSSIEIPAQVGDFRLVDRAVVDAIRAMPEHNRYVRGMFAWLGFSQIAVPYSRPARWAGSTSYSVKHMLRLAADGVVGYSKAPLRAPLLVGAVTTGAAALSGMYVGVAGSVRGRRRGTPAVNVGALLAGVQLMALGLLGEYVARIFDESLDRPLYVVREARGRLAAVDASADEVVVDGVVNGDVRDLFERRTDVVFEPRLVSRAR